MKFHNAFPQFPGSLTVKTLLSIAIIFCGTIARAACTSPSAAAGAMNYFTADSDMKYCNGTSWVSTKYGGIKAIGSIKDNSSARLYTSDISVVGNYLYAIGHNAANNFYIAIYDISDIANPTFAASYNGGNIGTYAKATTDGTYLYIISNTTLRIFSLSNPLAPAVVGSVTNANLSADKLVVSGNYLYNSQYGKMAIVDVTNKAAPSFISTMSNSTFGYGFTVSGNYAYAVGGWPSKLLIVDVTNKSSPAVAGSVNCNECGSTVAVYGNYAYLGAGGGSSDRLTIVDISNKAVPLIAGFKNDITWITEIVIKSNYAYAADDGGGFYTLDLTTPSNPTILQRVSVTTWSNGLRKISYDGNKLAALSDTGFLATFDLSPTNQPKPPQASELASGDSAYSQEIHVSGSTAVSMDSQGNFWTYNVSNPSSMSYIGTSKVPVTYGNYFTDAYFDSGYFYIAAPNHSSIFIFNLTTPSSPTLTTQLMHQDLGQVMAVTRSGNYIYTASSSGLSIFDASTITSPTHVATASASLSWPEKVLVSGSYAYVVQSNYLYIFDVSNPSAPALVGTLNDSTNLNNARDIAISGNYAFIINSSVMAVVDITNKSSPTYSTKTSSLGTINRILVSGTYAYISGSSLRSIDISVPTSPVLRHSLACSSCVGLAISGSTAFASDNSIPGVKSFNISNPLALALTSSVTTLAYYQSIQRIALKGNYALSGSAALKAITVTDITDAANPIITTKLTDNTKFTNLSDISVSGNYAYVAAGGYFTILDVTNPASPSIASFLNSATYYANGRRVLTSGNYAYYLSSNRLTTIDITNKSAPVFSGTLTHANLSGCSGLALTGSYLVTLCTTSSRLVIIDISTPSAPALAGSVSAGTTSATSVVISGNYAFINDSKVKVFDITNKTAPVLVKQFDGVNGCTGCAPLDLHVSGTTLYASDNAITVWDMTNPLAPEKLGYPIHSSNGANVFRMAFSSNRMVTTDGWSTLAVYEVSPLPAPQKSSKVFTVAPRLSGLKSIKVVGSTAYTLANGQLTTLDISDPQNPTILSSWGHPSLAPADTLEIAGNRAYIGEVDMYGVAILDITDPANPYFLSKIYDYPNFMSVSKLTVSGSYLYVVGGGRFSAVSISDPANMVITDDVTNASYTTALKGSYALTCDSSALMIVDLTDPNNLARSFFNDPSLDGCRDIKIIGNTAYVITTTNKSLVVIDVTNPNSPAILGSVSHATKLANLISVDVVGNYAYLASSEGNLTLVDISAPATPVINDHYNPGYYYTTQGLANPPYLYMLEASNDALKVLKATAFVSQGACSVAGAIDYISANNVYAYCNGSVLIPMGPSPGAGGAGCSSPTALAGSFNYDNTANKMNYCDGSAWVSIE